MDIAVNTILRSIAFDKIPNDKQMNDNVIKQYGYLDLNDTWRWDRSKIISNKDALYIINILHTKDVYNASVKISKFKENVKGGTKEEKISLIKQLKNNLLDHTRQVGYLLFIDDMKNRRILNIDDYFITINHFLLDYSFTHHTHDIEHYLIIKSQYSNVEIKLEFDFTVLLTVLELLNKSITDEITNEIFLQTLIHIFVFILDCNLATQFKD